MEMRTYQHSRRKARPLKVKRVPGPVWWGIWTTIAVLALGTFPGSAQVLKTRFESLECTELTAQDGGTIKGYVPPEIDLGNDALAHAIAAEGISRLRTACPRRRATNDYHLIVWLYEGPSTRHEDYVVALTSSIDRQGPEQEFYHNRIAVQRKAIADQDEYRRAYEEQRRTGLLKAQQEWALEQTRQEERRRIQEEQMRAERAKKEQAQALEQARLATFLRAYQAVNNEYRIDWGHGYRIYLPADDRQSQFLRAFLQNPFAYEGKVIALHGVLKNMVSSTKGVFRVDKRFMDGGNIQEVLAVVSGLPKGFNPPDGEALLVGKGLGKIDMVNGFGATVGLPHLHVLGVCIVSGQTDGVSSHTCRDVK